MTLFKRFAAALAAALCLASAPASATTYSIDFTDLWFNPAESGWGFNVIQQGNTLFGTLFVYGSDLSARWYVASGMTPQSAPAGQFKFGGKLYQTTGPFFGAASFNPSSVTVTEVGDISITFITSSTATLVYNVNTTTVTKNISRQSFQGTSPAGTYIGGQTSVTSACANGANNGLFANFIGDLTVNLSAQNVATLRIDYVLNGVLANCIYTGNYAQQGRLGTVSNGTWGCTQSNQSLNSGSFSMSNVDAQVNGLSANITASDQICTYTGRFGGIRNVNN